MEVLIEEGKPVYPGQVLVKFEDFELIAVRDQLRAKVAAAEAEYTKAMEGPRDEEKRAARRRGCRCQGPLRKDERGLAREEEKRQRKRPESRPGGS